MIAVGTLGFSYIGLLFLCCLFIPNILYALHPPIDPVTFRENRFFLALERVGQALCTALVLISSDLNLHGFHLRTIWLGIAVFLMLLYLLCWVRYFRGRHVTRDFLRPLLGVPLPLAVLPVCAFLFLSIYGKLLFLGIATVLLGIGHIGITAQHWTAWKKQNKD